MKKASEMTNEELAKALMSRVPLDSNNHDDIREASARLRKQDIIVAAQKAKGDAAKRERETVRHVCAYDISKCNPSGERLDPTKLDGFDECVYCGFDGVLCDASPYIEWGLQFKNMTEEETLEAEDYGQWLKKWAKTKGYAK